MEEVFRIIIITSFYASVIGIIIALLKKLLHNRLSPKWHYFIWTVLILKLIIPFGPESSISLFNAKPWVTVQSSVSNVYDQAISPAVQEEVSGEQVRPLPSIEQTLGNSYSSLLIVQAVQVLPYIWIFGALLLAFWLFHTYCLIRRKLQKSNTKPPQSLYIILENCKRRMGVKRDIEIIIQDIIDSPSLFGVISPKILLTPKTLALSDKEISYILLHELAHYQRRDPFANCVLLLLQVIHWFNPVIWYCFRMIRSDMEIAADDKVLSVLWQGEEKDYGKALLTVLASFNTPRFFPRLIGMIDEKKNIMRRIKMIKSSEVFRKNKVFFLFTGALCIILLSVFLLTNPLSANSKDRDFTIRVNPARYTLSMSSTPGISILVQDYGTADQVRYSASSGGFLEWNSAKVSHLGRSTETPCNSTVYWTPLLEDGSNTVLPGPEKISVNIAVYQKGLKLAERELVIRRDSAFYTVEPAEDVIFGQNLEQALSQAIIDQEKYYGRGEVATEGHILLGAEEKDGVVSAYTLASFGYFGFENGIFTKISGSGAIPTVMTFRKDDQGGYSLLSYQEPLDGAGFERSVKEMFPEKYWPEVLTQDGSKYSELARQQEIQAEIYLQEIGRKAEVSAGHVEKELLKLSSISASNKLFAEFTKDNAFLNSCPYWIGTREEIKDGVRYIYETRQDKTDDGLDLVIFSQKIEGGTVVKEVHYKIVGDDPQLVYAYGQPSLNP